MSRLLGKTLVAAAVFVVAVLLGAGVMFAAAAIVGATKKKLPRDDTYYEITNDAGDHGNYIETYHVPVPGTGRSVFCVVYSDKIQNGGGAGPSCDWEGFHAATG